MNPFDDLPNRAATHALEDQAIAAFHTRLTESGAFVLQASDRRDYGVDCQLEAVHGERATNVRVHVQLKGTGRAPNADGSVSVEVSRANLNYLLMQPYSLYVCFHAPTGHLFLRTAESVLRQYEHEGKTWSDQQTLTISFSEALTTERLGRLAALARSGALTSRDRRIDQSVAHPAAFASTALSTPAAIHVPEDPALAGQALAMLYERGGEAVISASFEAFAAVLGPDSDAMGPAYMAEINLGMDRPSDFPQRITDAIGYFKAKLKGGLYQPSSLHYTIGNAYSVLADEAAAKGAYQRALRDPALPHLPDLAAQIYKNLGTSLERLGEEDQAVEHYREALRLKPDLPEAHAAMGHHHLRGERFAKALAHFDQVVFMERRYGHASGVAGWRTNTLFNLNDGRTAFREINQLLAQADAEVWIWPWCARLVAAFGRANPENAVQAAGFWQRYIGAFPDHSAGRRELLLSSFYLRNQGHDIGATYAEFRHEFDRHIAQVDPEDAALLWDRLGHWAQDDEDWVEAERCFRKAYDLDGGHYGYCLGTALVFQDRFAESLPLLKEQAETLQPDAQSWFQLGVAYAGLDRPDEAIDAYRGALDLDPDHDLAMFNLGGTYWNAGDHPEALSIWLTAIARFPDHHLTAKLKADMPMLFRA